jgi:cupin 2 domain-containing protein
MKNIFDLSEIKNFSEEIFETIQSKENIKIERIISSGQTTPEDFWYDQDKNEWILLLQGEAELLFENNEKTILKAGDYLLIPSHKRHKVTYTSQNPPCIWLAIFF